MWGSPGVLHWCNGGWTMLSNGVMESRVLRSVARPGGQMGCGEPSGSTGHEFRGLGPPHCIVGNWQRFFLVFSADEPLQKERGATLVCEGVPGRCGVATGRMLRWSVSPRREIRSRRRASGNRRLGCVVPRRNKVLLAVRGVPGRPRDDKGPGTVTALQAGGIFLKRCSACTG